MGRKSFVRRIVLYLAILTALLFVILFFFLFSSYEVLETEIKESSDAFLQIYTNEFNNSLSKMDGVLKGITSQGEDLAKLGSAQENERTLSAIVLLDYMRKNVSENEMVDAVIVYDTTYEICLDANNNVRYREKNALREFTKEAYENEQLENGTWYFVKIDGNLYLFKSVKFGSRIIALYVKNQNLLTTLQADDNTGRFLALADEGGIIGKVWGADSKEIYEGKNLKKIDVDKYYEISKPTQEERMTLYCFTSKDVILRQTHAGMLIVFTAVCITILFMIFLLRYTRSEISMPMSNMVREMEQIKNGAYDTRIKGEFHTKEFQVLQTTVNQMVAEIIGLKISSYEKRIELQDMELKSIRLQLKPHFFLNALTTISSLSAQNKNAQIRTYIDALSKNVRYMFRAGFHTVSLQEEIEHVKNYFEMQELKYPGCVFYLVDIEQGLAEWKIPQMLIHTFVENEYKYAVSVDEILTLLIKISKQEYKGEEMLLIEIEDDGTGYPQEVLDYMNGRIAKTSEKGTRVGLWSVKRMLEIMYERQDLVILKNANPHGCINRIYIPQKAVHELEEEIIQNRV